MGDTDGSTARKGQILGLAAGGILIGAAFNPVRKLLVQSVSAVGGDWFEMLKADHVLARALFEKAEATTADQKLKRATLLMQLKHALAKHAMEEENVVYPALREHAEADVADHLNHDHGYIKNYLYQLDMIEKDSPAWIAKLREFRGLFEKHVREEEDEIFPALRAKLSKQQNKEVTTAANKEGLKAA